MKFILPFLVLFILYIEIIFTLSSNTKSKIDNRLICVKGKKGAKLRDINFVGLTKTSTNLIEFLKQFKPAHVLSKKRNYVEPKFISGTLDAIAKHECKEFNNSKKKPNAKEIYGIIFLNGNQLYSLFHDQDIKWNGAGNQLKYVWEELEDFEKS